MVRPMETVFSEKGNESDTGYLDGATMKGL
jgi:hypothetical protein